MSDLVGARTFEEDTLGHVPDLLTQLDVNAEGNVAAQVSTLVNQVRLILTAINGGLSFGDGVQSSRIGNMDGVNIQYNFTVTTQVEAIPHNLGRKPSGWIVVGQHFSGIGGGAVPLLISCGSDGDTLYGGGENRVDSIPSDWDNRMVYFRAEGDDTWLPGLYRIWLF